MRRKIVAGNWKMNKTASEATAFINEIKASLASDEVDVVLCVPHISICAAVSAVAGTNIKIGAQNMYYAESGAFTGEISPTMLVDAGVTHVIIGHSERRAYFGETDQIVNKKVLKAIEHKLTAIVCVGETLEEREQGITIDLVRTQVKVALMGVSCQDAKNLVVAYEPVWAIGTGKTATSEQAEEVCAAIRKVLCEIYDEETANATRIQYGGSVTPANAAELFGMPNIDGGLVGGASLKADFSKLVCYK